LLFIFNICKVRAVKSYVIEKKGAKEHNRRREREKKTGAIKT
jgi:hypothetical protein